MTICTECHGNGYTRDENMGIVQCPKCGSAPPAVGRATILAEAARLVSVDRAAQYGDAEESFCRIAGLWSAYLGIEIKATDVALMMCCLKISRAKGGGSGDSWIDIAGYAALGGELDPGK